MSPPKRTPEQWLRVAQMLRSAKPEEATPMVDRAIEMAPHDRALIRHDGGRDAEALDAFRTVADSTAAPRPR